MTDLRLGALGTSPFLVGTAGVRSILGFWDTSVNGYRFLYIDNGTVVVSDTMPSFG